MLQVHFLKLALKKEIFVICLLVKVQRNLSTADFNWPPLMVFQNVWYFEVKLKMERNE